MGGLVVGVLARPAAWADRGARRLERERGGARQQRFAREGARAGQTLVRLVDDDDDAHTVLLSVYDRELLRWCGCWQGRCARETFDRREEENCGGGVVRPAAASSFSPPARRRRPQKEKATPCCCCRPSYSKTNDAFPVTIIDRPSQRLGSAQGKRQIKARITPPKSRPLCREMRLRL